MTPERDMLVLTSIWLAIILWCLAFWIAVALLMDRLL